MLPGLSQADQDQRWMEAALKLAEAALETEDVPVGALIVDEGRVIGRGFNQREALQDPTAHAEVLAITAAAQERGHWRLDRTTMYVTLEPCPMCAGAIVQARIARVVFGAYDEKAGACGSLYEICSDPRLNHRADVVGGVEADASAELLRAFFRYRRSLGEK